MKLELKHIAPYLPYGLKCQYEGVINGSDISKYKRDFEKENTDFLNWQYYKPIPEVKGLKIAPLKTIISYKKYWIATCGIHKNGQKKFYNGLGMKPILRPLSDLIKEIEVNGERFVPIEWFEIGDDISDSEEYDQGNIKLIKTLELISKFNIQNDILFLPHGVVKKLLEWHFDIYNLIKNDLAIDINTL